ncbi:MAG: phage terminase large subunit family protein [Rhizobiales bacterium]|nr:phage terminase large subunit family protein [Hyphomicrobiales bacterium]
MSRERKAKSRSAYLKLPEFFERAAAFLTPIDDVPPDEWAADNRSYSSKTGEPGPRNARLTPYMVPFARRIWARSHASVIAITSAQSGKTDTLLDVIGQRLDVRPAPILYVGPGETFVETQFEPRLEHMLQQAKRLSKFVAPGKQSKTLVKKVRGVRVRLGYAGSPASMKSDPFAIGIVDEYDEMAANIKGQGDPWGLVVARGDTFADAVSVAISTCSQGIVETEKDPVNGLVFWAIGEKDQIASPIWRLFQQGTRHHWAWPCFHCEEYFIPMRSHLRWEKDADPTTAARTAFLCCPNCGGVLENNVEPGGTDHKPWMNERGVMIAPRQTLEDALADRNHPANDSWSQWSSGLTSPFVTWGARARRLVTALQSGEEDKIQTVVNAGFAELYTPGAHGDMPEWREVAKHRLPYGRLEVPLGVLRIVAGVDVQKRSLIYVIRGFGSRGTSWLLDYGELLGDTSEPLVWSDLALKLMTPIGGLIVEKVFIDSGFRPNKSDAGDEHKVYEWTHRHTFLAMPTKGRDTLGGKPFVVSKIEVKPNGKLSPYSIDLVHINTDFFKSLVHSRLRTPMNEPGAFFLFSQDEREYEDYARQLVSEVRVLGPKLKPTWVPRQKANHFLDAEALAAAAAYMLNVQAIPEGVERPGPEAEPPVADDATDDTGAVYQRELEALEAPPSPRETEIEKAAAVKVASIRDRFRNMGRRF